MSEDSLFREGELDEVEDSPSLAANDATAMLATMTTLAAAITSPAMYDRVVNSGLSQKDLDQRLGDVWLAMTSTTKGSKVNPTMVEAFMVASLGYKGVDARRLVLALLERSRSGINDEQVVENLGVIKRTAALRRLRELGQSLLATIDTADISEVAGKASKTIERIVTGAAGNTTTQTIQDLIKDARRRRENPTPDERRISIGIPEIDELMGGGIKLGHTFVFGADSHVGKTTFLKHFALHISQTEPIGIITFESEKEEIVDGLIEMQAGVSFSAMAKNPSAEAYTKIAQAEETIYRRKILIDIVEGLTVEQVSSRMHLWAQEHGVTTVLIDYVQDIDRSTNYGRDDLNFAHISKRLRQAARRNKQALIEFSQLNEDNAKDKGKGGDGPDVGRLAFTKQWRKDASGILMADRKDGSDDVVTANTTRLFLRKNRFNDGLNGRAWMFYDAATKRLRPCDGQGRVIVEQQELQTIVHVTTPQAPLRLVPDADDDGFPF